MNRVRLLLLTAYLVLVLVGGAIYAQSVNNMVQYTDADQVFPRHIWVSNLTIPAFVGETRNYFINCTFRFDNPTKVPVIIRAFTFVMSIDNGEPGSMFEDRRLLEEKVGEGSMSPGISGPRINPGRSLDQSFPFLVLARDSSVLNHTNLQGKYIVVLHSVSLSYGYADTTLIRQVWFPPFVEEVSPVG